MKKLFVILLLAAVAFGISARDVVLDFQKDLPAELINRSGKKVPTETALKGKMVAIYASASWCGPCRAFTPKLVEFYKSAAKSAPVELIFLSSDKTGDAMMAYMKKDAMIPHKEKLNAIYRDMLPVTIQLPAQYQHWRFNILTGKKDEILKALFAEGLFASSHYMSLSNGCMIAQNLHEHVLNLFNDQYYTEEQAVKTCEIINSII